MLQEPRASPSMTGRCESNNAPWSLGRRRSRVRAEGARRSAVCTLGASSARQIEQVREPRVGLAVDERTAVEAGRVQPGRERHGHGRGGVPLVLAATVRVHVAVAEDDRHRLRAGGSHRDQFGVEGGDEVVGERRRTAATDEEPDRVRRRGAGRPVPVRREHEIPGGERDRAHVGRPRSASATWTAQSVRPRFSELPGPVERVDDPDPLGPVPGIIVGRFLGEDRVVGPSGRRGRTGSARSPAVARCLQLGGVGDPVAQLQQETTRPPRRAAPRAGDRRRAPVPLLTFVARLRVRRPGDGRSPGACRWRGRRW